MGALGDATIKTSVVTCVVRCGDRQAFRAGLLSLAAGRRGRQEHYRDMVMPRTTKMTTTRTTNIPSITRVTTHSPRRWRRGLGGGDNNENDYDYYEYRDDEKDSTRRRRTTKRGGGGIRGER